MATIPPGYSLTPRQLPFSLDDVFEPVAHVEVLHRPEFLPQPLAFLVVLKSSHPLRPVFRLHTAGFGPAVGRVVQPMPFQHPQLFKAYFPY